MPRERRDLNKLHIIRRPVKPKDPARNPRRVSAANNQEPRKLRRKTGAWVPERRAINPEVGGTGRYMGGGQSSGYARELFQGGGKRGEGTARTRHRRRDKATNAAKRKP